MFFYTDAFYVKDHILNVTGWAAGEGARYPVVFHAFSGSKELSLSEVRSSRPDVAYARFGGADIGDVGFYLKIPVRGLQTVRIAASSQKEDGTEDKKEIIINTGLLAVRKNLKEAKAFLVRQKFSDYSPVYKVWNKSLNKYYSWFRYNRTAPWELAEQRKNHFSYEPLISIVVPVYRTPLLFLREMLSSVVNQTYGRFELCIVNADPSCQEVSEELKRWQAMDARIRVKDLTENRSISENTNEAFAMAQGEYIALLDHDDKLELDTLYRYVERLDQKPETDLLYCDEDKIRERSDYYFFPNFKPDFNRDLLYGNNYICHFLMIRKSLVEEVGGWDPAYNGAQDYDLILKCIEKTDRIEHIDRVLYHWRSYAGSTSKNHDNKSYAEDAGERALNAHFRRMGYDAVTQKAGVAGWYETRFIMKEKPLVSVLIPNKDHIDDLDKCLQSLLHKVSYEDLEIIVIENNSAEASTFAYYEKIQQETDKVKVLTWPGKGFNFSAINNYGFEQSHGEYILLLNNDVEVITAEMFENLLGYFTRPDVGMVGCKLLYPDETIQHAGVLVGGGGLADHMFKGYKDSTPGYMCRAVTSYDVSAVTAACMMVSRRVYEEVGGLEEELAVAFNDVDFCLKVREKGYTIVYDAKTKLHHYESKSRGAENTPEKFARFSQEMAYLSEKWRDRVSYNDPYYNRNMSYLYNFIPDYFSLPAKCEELGEAFGSRMEDQEAFYALKKEHETAESRKTVKRLKKKLNR